MKQTSTTNGINTSVKVHAIVSDGITIEAFGKSYFLSYSSNPWFKRKLNQLLTTFGITRT